MRPIVIKGGQHPHDFHSSFPNLLMWCTHRSPTAKNVLQAFLTSFSRFTRSPSNSQAENTDSRPASVQAAHLKQRFVQHGQLCTEDGKEWEIPTFGTLRINFVQEPSSDRTLGEVGTVIPRLVNIQYNMCMQITFNLCEFGYPPRVISQCSGFCRSLVDRTTVMG